MTRILTDISYYDKTLHLPIPLLSFVKEQTGFDLYLETGDELKAKAYVKTYTQAAWNYLRSTKTLATANAMEYLIATDENWRGEFLLYVTALISSVYTLGGVEVFNKSESADLIRELPMLARAAASGLLATKRLNVKYKYREGY